MDEKAAMHMHTCLGSATVGGYLIRGLLLAGWPDSLGTR